MDHEVNIIGQGKASAFLNVQKATLKLLLAFSLFFLRSLSLFA